MRKIQVHLHGDNCKWHVQEMTCPTDIVSIDIMLVDEEDEKEKPEREITFDKELLEWLDELESSELDAKVGSEKDSDFYWEHRGAQLAYARVGRRVKERKNLVDEGVAGPEKPERRIDGDEFKDWGFPCDCAGEVYVGDPDGEHYLITQKTVHSQRYLIAAAPDLMRAAIDEYNWFDEYDHGVEQWDRHVKLGDAITKAGFGRDIKYSDRFCARRIWVKPEVSESDKSDPEKPEREIDGDEFIGWKLRLVGKEGASPGLNIRNNDWLMSTTTENMANFFLHAPDAIEALIDFVNFYQQYESLTVQLQGYMSKFTKIIRDAEFGGDLR